MVIFSSHIILVGNLRFLHQNQKNEFQGCIDRHRVTSRTRYPAPTLVGATGSPGPLNLENSERYSVGRRPVGYSVRLLGPEHRSGPSQVRRNGRDDSVLCRDRGLDGDLLGFGPDRRSALERAQLKLRQASKFVVTLNISMRPENSVPRNH